MGVENHMPEELWRAPKHTQSVNEWTLHTHTHTHNEAYLLPNLLFLKSQYYESSIKKIVDWKMEMIWCHEMLYFLSGVDFL